jgi:hypothetical protein
VLYWQLAPLGVRCEVIAPTPVPVKAGDRVKTDRRDAMKLPRSYRTHETGFFSCEEGSAGRGRGVFDKENPRIFYAAGSTSPKRVSRTGRLPTDREHAVSTREYRSDQSSR